MTIALPLLLGTAACAPPEETLPVVARGRYVEIATDRSDPICGGTVAFMDGYIEAAFELLGETPPDEVFVRYEWLPQPEVPYSAVGEGNASIVDDGILIRADRLINEHELVHAVHLTAWPRSARFLHEGFAVLLDSRRSVWDGARAPPLQALDDEVLDPTDALSYGWSYYLVSQIILDHGMDGLRELWHAVPDGATATEVRATYEALFGQSIEVLLEPWILVYSGPETDFMTEEFEIERAACDFALCTEPPVAWEGDVWTMPGPSSCEDDAQAIGPASDFVSVDYVPVWTSAVIDTRPTDVGADENVPELLRWAFQGEGYGGRITVEAQPDGLWWQALPCWARCGLSGSYELPRYPEGFEWLGSPGRYRIEVGRHLDELPTDEPGELVMRR